MDKFSKLLVASLLIFTINIKYLSAEDFVNTSLGQELVNLGLKFLDNPGDFFFNIHANNEDFSPVYADKNGAIRFNLLPAFLPFTWANISVKAKLFNEQEILPQIDLVGQYGDMLALRFVSGDVEPSFKDYSGGIVLSKSATDETKFFGGVKYSNVSMGVKLSSSSAIEFGEFSVSELNFEIADVFVFTGLVHQKDINKPSRLTVQMGYGFEYKKIVSRIMVSKKHMDLGMDIYPEGLFVFHPFLSYHWNF
ncbi:MAG: hypothetical protein A2474_00195 [Elusimicrobia bacterium RIFOXYC2_FULL_34_12]|nr:MAG: hypothetical protein A2474_00195 [Elusimicrobia bacterium RIFOXYC2_FULL_34_12]OGS37980.1 MAG: hypothetical protein A2551_04795 [Elusimicrobia bacterium RIFOXYD2_FULL_34_30]HAM38158.1 hypothetical protein [Elusimicrobiota bacterium]